MMQARGKHLDRIGELYGFRRKRWWLFAWPLDRWYRRRLLDHICGLTPGRVIVRDRRTKVAIFAGPSEYVTDGDRIEIRGWLGTRSFDRQLVEVVPFSEEELV